MSNRALHYKGVSLRRWQPEQRRVVGSSRPSRIVMYLVAVAFQLRLHNNHLDLMYAGNKEKARKAAKAVKKSQWKKALKPRYSVVFHRPKTLKRTRNPKVPRVRYDQLWVSVYSFAWLVSWARADCSTEVPCCLELDWSVEFQLVLYNQGTDFEDTTTTTT